MLLIAAVGILWVARALMNLAFKIVLVFAVVGVAAVVGGAKMPEGVSVDTLVSGLSTGLQQTVELGSAMLQTQVTHEKVKSDQ